MVSKPRPSTAPADDEKRPVDMLKTEDGKDSSSLDEQKYPPMRTVAVAMAALYLAMFLVSLVSAFPP